MATKKDSFSLTVPLDVSQAEGGAATVKVAVVDANDRVLQSQLVKTDEKKPSATFAFDEVPAGARVVVGPADADDEALPRLETVSTSLSPRMFARSSSVTLNAVLIPRYYWLWWGRWCRDFTITGRLLCPDGKPVPGATVCAFDVDWFFIWNSTQQIGCATTDATGAFTIKFRWCCGWYPWWWWYLRTWSVDLKLAEAVTRNLPPELKVKPLPRPGPNPDLAFIEALVPESQRAQRAPQAPAGKQQARRVNGLTPQAQQISVLRDTTSEFFARAEALRPALASLLAPVPQLRIWPWWPWYPWRDCNPDVIFKATQPCGGETKVVLDQTFWDADWNIDTTHDVTLIANDQACCAGDVTICGDPCLGISHVCGHYRGVIDQGDPTASVTSGMAFPGYASPLNETNADRPFAETIRFDGITECMGEDVDWYQVLYERWEAPSVGSPFWGALTPISNPLALGAITRTYYTILGVTSTDYRTFTPTTRDGKLVYPARKNLEATLSVPWICYGECHTLFYWNSNLAEFPDGTYRLRIKAYKETAGGTLVEQVLSPCHDDDPNEIIVTIDNRGFGAVHPASSATHPCGGTTIHLCEMEPDVDVEEVRLMRSGGASIKIEPCGIYKREDGDAIEIDYLVSDSDSHLGEYSLYAEFGESDSRNLLDGTILTAIDLGVAVGPTYYKALQPGPNQGAIAPDWPGGRMTVRIEGAKMAEKFPYPCCYQLDLEAAKRPIVGCTKEDYKNRTSYSFFY